MGAAAVIAGVGAVASIGGSLLSSNAAQSAAGTQAAAANAASERALQQYQQTRTDLTPFRDTGTSAIDQLNAIYGLPTTASTIGPIGNPLTTQYGISGLTFQPTQAQLEATPGYKFDLSQGLQSVQNANAATGRGISGAALKGAANYATGLANNTLSTQQGIFQSNLGNVVGGLQNLSATGLNAGVQTGAQGVTATGNANALQVGGANATAAGQVGSANAISGGLNSIGSAPLNYALYNQLLGNNSNNSNASFTAAANSSPFMVNGSLQPYSLG